MMKKMLSLLLTGVLLMGIGSAICVFEFSSYTFDAIPPQSTSTLNVRTPSAEGPIYFSGFYALEQDVAIAVDDSLSDQTLRLEITGPDMFKYYIYQHGTTNNLYLSYNGDPAKILSAFLDSMRSRAFPNPTPNGTTITIYASTATAQRLHIGEDPAIAETRSQLEDLRQQHDEELDDIRTNYEARLQDVREDYEERLLTQQTEYENTLNQTNAQHTEELSDLRADYEDQLQTQREYYETQMQTLRDNYEEQLQALRNN